MMPFIFVAILMLVAAGWGIVAGMVIEGRRRDGHWS